MKTLLALMLIIVAAGCGKNNSGGAAGEGAQASAGLSMDCLYNKSLCDNNNTVYNDYRYSGFMAYPHGQYSYNQQYNQDSQRPRYVGPVYGQRNYRYYSGGYGGYNGGYQASYGYRAGFNSGYGNGINQQYQAPNYGNGQVPNTGYNNGYAQPQVYGNGYAYGQVPQGTLAAGGVPVGAMPNLCSCPVNYRPVYNGTYGLGCLAQNQMNQYINTAYYYGAQNDNNNQWVNWPQYSNRSGGSNYPGNNGCFNNVAWSCMVDAPSTCPSNTRCQLVGSSNRMGICVR